MTKCVICDAELTIVDRTEVNEIIVCQECGSELEVTCLDPVMAQLAPEEEEDWGE